MNTDKPILKVKTKEKAEKIIEIADLMLISADYIFEDKRKWYVIRFDCHQYVFTFLQRRLRKELK